MPNTKSKKILIMIGPQGAGNHLFSKIFASSDKIGGWKTLNDHYWKGHHTEPFANLWTKGMAQDVTTCNDYDYWVTSCSIPFVVNGSTTMPRNVVLVHDYLQDAGYDVQIAVITRDVTILEHQQERVRGFNTLEYFMNQIDLLDKNRLKYHVFSHESLLLLGQSYVDHITHLTGFPNILLKEEIIEVNANAKYIRPADTKDCHNDTFVQLACEDSKR